MDFAYDPSKSRHNKQKHGIDFVEAQKLWCDEDRIVIPARSDDEPRFGLISMKGGHIWIAFYTIRKQIIRLISVRRARKNEKQLYESGRIG